MEPHLFRKTRTVLSCCFSVVFAKSPSFVARVTRSEIAAAELVRIVDAVLLAPPAELARPIVVPLDRLVDALRRLVVQIQCSWVAVRSGRGRRGPCAWISGNPVRRDTPPETATNGTLAVESRSARTHTSAALVRERCVSNPPAGASARTLKADRAAVFQKRTEADSPPFRKPAVFGFRKSSICVNTVGGVELDSNPVFYMCSYLC